MSIAEKLQTIVENEKKVYDKGEERGHMQGFGEGFTNGYSQGYEVGKAEGGGGDGLDEFWDTWQNNGKRTSYRDAFSETSFTHISPKYPIKPKNADGLFIQSRNLETVDWDKFDLSETSSLYTTFAYCDKLKIVDTDLATSGAVASGLNAIFREDKALERVKSLTIFPEAALKNSFDGCVNLVDITIAGTIGNTVDFHWSTKLSADSIRSIMGALSTTASGKTLTLSLVAVDKAFETSEGANDGRYTDAWKGLYFAHADKWVVSLL